MLLLFGAIQCIVGYERFSKSLTNEYNESAFRTANTAAVLIDGDLVDRFLETSGESEDYVLMQERLDSLCQNQDVTLIYAICPDTDDYDEFTTLVSVANSNSGYDPWVIGYRRATTNDEYRKIYKDIYENGLERGTVMRTSGLNGRDPHITSLIPIRDGSGAVKAILCVQRPMKELTVGRHRFMRYVIISTLLLAILSSLSAYFFLRKHFVRPMKKVIHEADRFAHDNTEADESTFFNISTIREIETLAGSLTKMEKDTLDNIDRITRITAENKRIEADLVIARKIQASVLPNEFPPFPERNDFEIYASMTPAKEVGGDFYDFFLIDEDHLGLVIADVSGKGVPAALFMMIAKLLIKLRANAGGSPGKMLSDVNNTLCDNNKMELFVTAWIAIITLSTGEGFAVNAGHEHPALRRADGKYGLVKYRHGIPLASMEDVTYTDHEFRLEKGDSLFVYTDGVTEATDRDNRLFGEERLVEALNIDPDASPEECIKNVKNSIDEFIGDAEQFDDITMLGLRYKANEN